MGGISGMMQPIIFINFPKMGKNRQNVLTRMNGDLKGDFLLTNCFWKQLEQKKMTLFKVRNFCFLVRKFEYTKVKLNFF